MYLLFAPWVGGCGQWVKFPCGYGICGVCEAGVGWAGLQGSLGLCRGVWGTTWPFPGESGTSWSVAWGSPGGVCLSWGPCAGWQEGQICIRLVQEMPLDCLGPPPKAAGEEGECPRRRGRRQEGWGSFPSARQGKEQQRSGNEWGKEGAVVWCQISPSVPWGPAARKKHERISGFLFVSVGAKNFLSLSSYQKLLMLCLWCGKPKAVIWALLLTGFYKCTQKH